MLVVPSSVVEAGSGAAGALLWTSLCAALVREGTERRRPAKKDLPFVRVRLISRGSKLGFAFRVPLLFSPISIPGRLDFEGIVEQQWSKLNGKMHKI